jgi:hypothetical protein
MRQFATILLAGVLLSGCVAGRPPIDNGINDAGDQDSTAVAVEKTVTLPVDHLDDWLFADPPSCILVLPFEAGAGAEHRSADVENAAARQFSLKVGRVIGATERRRLVRDMALNLSHPADRSAFAASTGCRHFLTINPFGKGSSFALVWAERRLGLSLRSDSLDTDPERPLWQVHRMAARSDVGMPLSPLSALSAIARAGKLAGDKEIPRSILDDVMRRAADPFPSFR